MPGRREWRKDWPDWEAHGRRVEVVHDDGSKISGILDLEDEVVTDEGDVPFFKLILDSGEAVPFDDRRPWRFV